MNVSTFVSNGFQAVQQVSTRNLEFRDGTLGNVVVEFDVDIVTDIDWLQAAGVLLIVGGFATAVA